VARLSIFLIAVDLIAGTVGSDGVSGGDTFLPSQNLEIRDWYDLDDVRNNLAGNHTLINDLDSTTAGYEELASPKANGGKGWETIGSLFVDPVHDYIVDPTDSFTGSLDGQGYEITDLFIGRPDEDGVGLFGSVGEGVIENLGVVNAEVTGRSYVGGLVGGGWATVSNSYSTGSVTGDAQVGGLVGANYATVSVSNSFWDTETSGQATSEGGTGKTTAQMQSITTFILWDIVAVAPGETNPAYIWNIVAGETYPFLSWQPVS
jgi:hypothetical protein